MTLNTLLTSLPQELLEHTFQALSTTSLLKLRETNREMRNAVDTYVSHSLNKAQQKPISGPLPIDGILSSSNALQISNSSSSESKATNPESDTFIKLNTIYSNLQLEWKERDLDLQIFPKTPLFRAVDFEELQTLTTEVIEANEALRLCWPQIRREINALDLPIENASADEIRAFLSADENQSAIQEVRTLELNGLGLKFVPKEISKFTGLEALNLDNNALTEIPSYLPAELLDLSANFNQITEIPPHLPASLENLILNHNHLSQIPTNLPPDLGLLNLANNQITEIPEGLPIDLEHLILDNNQISQIDPAHLPEFLETLYLDNNQITEIPQGLPTELLTLCIRHNPIQQTAETLPPNLQIYS